MEKRETHNQGRIRLADYDLMSTEIQIPFVLGEKTLFRLKYKGFRCHVDMFGTAGLASPDPPFEELKKSGYRIAMTLSQPVTGLPPKIRIKNGMLCFRLKHYRRFYIETSGDFLEYQKRYKSKTLANLKRKSRKLKESCRKGEFFRIFKTPEEIREFIRIARGISEKTFQFKLLGQGLQVSEAYVNDYLAKAKQGRIIGLIVYAEDKPVAYNLCPIYGDGVMIYYYTGYDPEFGHFSPGTVLQYLTIRTAFNTKKVGFYDFCTGEGEHKMLYTDDYQLCADFVFFPLRFRYVVTILLKIAYDFILQVIKYPLKRIGVGKKIRKEIRRKAVKSPH